MEYIRLTALCVIALLPLAILKKTASEQALLLILAVVLFVVLRCIASAMPLVNMMEELFLRAGIEGAYIDILLRAVVVSLTSHVGAQLCRDGGSQSFAAAVEIAGTVAVLVIATPLLEAVTKLLTGYFG